MNELFSLLIECVKEETACYRRLVLLARDQKDLLVCAKADVLPANTRLLEKQVFQLTPVMGNRNEHLAQLAKLFGKKKMSLDEAVKKAPVEIRNELKKAYGELLDAAKALAVINGISGKLLNNAMKLTKFTLKTIREGGKKKSFSMAVALGGSKPSVINRVV